MGERFASLEERFDLLADYTMAEQGDGCGISGECSMSGGGKDSLGPCCRVFSRVSEADPFGPCLTALAWSWGVLVDISSFDLPNLGFRVDRCSVA